MLCLGEDLDRQHILVAVGKERSCIEIVRSKGSRDVVFTRDLFSVEPDVRAIVNTIEVEPIYSSRRCQGHKLRSIPPGTVVGAFRTHGEIAEYFSDGIVHARNVAQIHPEERIRKNPGGHLGPKHRAWY